MTISTNPPDFETFLVDDKQKQIEERLSLLLKQGTKVEYLIIGHANKVEILHKPHINVLKKNSKVKPKEGVDQIDVSLTQ